MLLFFTALLGCETNTTDSAYAMRLLGNKTVKVYQLDLSYRYNIKKMNNRFVEVTGYYYNNFEDVAIYSCKPGFLRNANALWVSSIYSSADTSLEKQLIKLSGKKITLFGKLDRSDKGHLGYYQGAIDSVFFVKQN